MIKLVSNMSVKIKSVVLKSKVSHFDRRIINMKIGLLGRNYSKSSPKFSCNRLSNGWKRTKKTVNADLR